MMKPTGGLISCSKCGFINGYIYEGNTEYMNYVYMCNCGEFGKIEVYRGHRPALNKPKRAAYLVDNILLCPNCERELLWVKPDSTLNYAFNMVCKCGVEYDEKFDSNQSEVT